MVASTRRSLLQTTGLALALSLAVGFLLALRRLSLESFAIHTAVSLLYSLAIGLPATLVFDRLKPRIGRPLLVQWAIYAGVLLTIVLVSSAVVGLVLVLVGLVEWNELWVTYRRGLLISLVVSIPTTIAAVTMSRLSESLHRSEHDKQRALATATEAKLASLESRVRPHFLFNALNSAIALIPEDPRRAEDVLERLSALLRSSLDAQAPLVSLGDELRVVTDYLEIERARFGERLGYAIEVPDPLRTIAVPSFAVQTLVENCVKYAVSPRKQGARIVIRAHRDGDRVAIDVSDDGPGFGDAAIWQAGHGLDALRGRLAALLGERARLIAPLPGAGGATVRIEIEDR
jgi:sensor histidine kinase YesM